MRFLCGGWVEGVKLERGGLKWRGRGAEEEEVLSSAQPRRGGRGREKRGVIGHACIEEEKGGKGRQEGETDLEIM